MPAMSTTTASTLRDANAVTTKAPSKILTDDFFAVAIFSGVGLLVSLVAIICGQQGLWF